MAPLARTLLALCLLAAPAPASADGAILNRVKSLLGEMGFKPSLTSNGALVLESMGAHKIDVYFTPSKGGTALTIYTVRAVPADRQALIPAVAMLKANNGYPFSFAIFGEPGQRSLDIEKTVDGALVSKVMLRKSIDQIIEMVDSNQEIWNHEGWPVKAAQ